MFSFFRARADESGSDAPPPPGPSWGKVSAGYEKPEGWFGPGRLLRIAGVAVGVGLLLVAIAQWAPGVPREWRPIGRFKLWQAERLFARGLEAERAGDWETARIAYLACLETRPDAPAPRWRLGRYLGEQGRFEEAVTILAPVTRDPALFVHDTLLSAGKNAALARFAFAGVLREPARRGVWLVTLRLALARCDAEQRERVTAEMEQAAATAKPAEAAWLRAVGGEARADAGALGAALRDLEHAGAPDAADVLLGLELWLRAGRVSDAWIWVQRHRGRLGAYDAWFADWRVALARDADEASVRVRELAATTLDATRWHRLVAAALAEGRRHPVEALGALAEKSPPPASVCVSFWATWMSLRDETEARAWAERYQRAGGGSLPILHGRALAGDDAEAAWRAGLLLAAEAGLPREMLQAIALRQGPAGG